MPMPMEDRSKTTAIFLMCGINTTINITQTILK